MSNLFVYVIHVLPQHLVQASTPTRDHFMDQGQLSVEVVVAQPSSASPPALADSKLVEGLEWRKPDSETITIGTDVFRVSPDEALLRTLAKEVNLSTSLEHLVRGGVHETYNQRLKMKASINHANADAKSNPTCCRIRRGQPNSSPK